MTKEDKQKSELLPAWPFNWQSLDKSFENFRREFEKSFSSFPSLSSLPKMTSLSCDLIDEGDNYVIKAEMPGIKKDEVKLNVFDNSLEISAHHKEEEEEKKKNYLRKERSEISYYRVLPMPDKVVPEKAAAKLTDGILSITIPKSTPSPKPKSSMIQVQ